MVERKSCNLPHTTENKLAPKLCASARSFTRGREHVCAGPLHIKAKLSFNKLGIKCSQIAPPHRSPALECASARSCSGHTRSFVASTNKAATNLCYVDVHLQTLILPGRQYLAASHPHTLPLPPAYLHTSSLAHSI